MITLVVPVLLSGCGLKQGPASLSIEPGTYEQSFSAALGVLRDEGLDPSLRDPRGGVIEAGPAATGSLLEPWKPGHGSLDAALESTIHHQRRRVRLEFTPGSQPDGRPFDLTQHDDALDLHIQAWIEREYRPGERRNLWSRRLSEQAVVYAPGEREEPVESRFWLPVRRDAEYESHLAALLDAAFGTRSQGNRGN